MEAVSYQPSTGDVTALVAGGGILSLLYLGFLVLMIVAGWKIFEKAGEEGWKVLIPIRYLELLDEMDGDSCCSSFL